MLVRRLLVPVDLSERSARALAYACELATTTGAAVDVLYVVPGPGQLRSAIDGYLGRPLPHAGGDELARARVELEELVRRVAPPATAPRAIVDSGDAAAVIVRTAAETPSDLIVMATRGHRGVGEVLFGSVTHKVVTCARCPVLTLSA